MRITDKIGRWGGEEFIILLAETNIIDAILAAEKLCRIIADTPVGNNMRITASICVCSYQVGQTMEDTINIADELMYLAKNEGKNRVKVASDVL